MQRSVVTLRSEEEMEGYGTGNVCILRVMRMFTNRVGSHWVVVALISEKLGLTGRPSKQAGSSSRITMVEYKRTCQLLPSKPRPNPSSDKRAGHSSFERRHQLGSHKTLTYSKLRRLLLRCGEGNDVSDVRRVVLCLGAPLGQLEGVANYG